MKNPSIEKLQDLMIEKECWPDEIYQRDGQWFMASSRIQYDDQEISEDEALSYVQGHARSLMGERWLFVLQNPKSAPCLICEKLLEPVFEKSQEQPYDGGEAIISFHYGSRFDWMGSRSPIIDNNKIIGSQPRKDLLNIDSRIEKLASCSDIKCIICDDCFEKKSHLFRGYEKDENGKLELVVE